MTLTALINEARLELDNAEEFCQQTSGSADSRQRETEAFARLRALEDAHGAA